MTEDSRSGDPRGPAPDDEFVVAVDVGGSLTKLAYAGPTGALSAVDRVRTEVGDDADVLVRRLAEQVCGAVAARPDQRCRGLGIVVPGIIDSAAGRVRAAPNLGWYDVALRDRLTELTGLPTALGHDVRSGGLAEWRSGAGRGVSDLLFLPLGTGIAGALVVDGRMLEADGYAGEIGHTRVDAAGRLECACGQVGCLETVASAAGVARSRARFAASDPVPASTVADLARAGDPAARAAFAVAADGLTEALLRYATLLAPELVVVGGGLAGAADLFLPAVQRGLEDGVTFQRVPRLVTARLGPDAGVVGAGLLGWDQYRAGRPGPGTVPDGTDRGGAED